MRSLPRARNTVSICELDCRARRTSREGSWCSRQLCYQHSEQGSLAHTEGGLPVLERGMGPKLSRNTKLTFVQSVRKVAFQCHALRGRDLANIDNDIIGLTQSYSHPPYKHHQLPNGKHFIRNIHAARTMLQVWVPDLCYGQLKSKPPKGI